MSMHKAVPDDNFALVQEALHERMRMTSSMLIPHDTIIILAECALSVLGHAESIRYQQHTGRRRRGEPWSITRGTATYFKTCFLAEQIVEVLFKATYGMLIAQWLTPDPGYQIERL